MDELMEMDVIEKNSG